MGLLFKLFEQVYTFSPKGEGRSRAQEQKLILLEAPFVEEIIRNGYCKVTRHKGTNDPYYETKIHQKQGNIESDKWHP